MCAAPASPAQDRDLFAEAKKARSALDGSTARQADRGAWEGVVLLYRRVVARYPESRYGDDALLAVGDLYAEMARRFGPEGYEQDAVKAYRTLLADYPTSPLGEDAVYAIFELARDLGGRDRVLEAGQYYLAVFPKGKRAQQVRNLMQTAPTKPKPTGSGLAAVRNLRFWSGATSTRVVVDLEREVDVKYDRIGNPDRLWIDLLGTTLDADLKDRTFPVGDGLLEQVRIGPNRQGVIRVVLDFKSVGDHSFFYLHDPERLVIDVQAPTPEAPGAPSVLVAGGESPPAASEAATTPALREAEAPVREARATPAAEEPTTDADGPPASGPDTATTPATPPTAVAASTGEADVATTPPAPAPPAVNGSGSYSLARQLGLGARTIVIDPGHGGHDPGSIGHGGLREKDLVLDVATRLAELVRRELGADVIMTRSTDVFLPLEERTAIANAKGADLFLSIHANSSRNLGARGIETYFLNFATDPHAEAVAARENAISAATLKDLQGLVKSITLNSKIHESRDFATAVHQAMIGRLQPAKDRGVRTAPFYVLIGANMPSILAEIAFVSHPDEAKLLRSSDYRQNVAQSLLDGVREYLDQLNRTQTQQLTSRAANPTVGGREARAR